MTGSFTWEDAPLGPKGEKGILTVGAIRFNVRFQKGLSAGEESEAAPSRETKKLLTFKIRGRTGRLSLSSAFTPAEEGVYTSDDN